MDILKDTKCQYCEESIEVIPYFDQKKKESFVDYGICTGCGQIVILPPTPYLPFKTAHTVERY